jgi:branched-chain amino acid transport system ATP-binding protein
MKPSNPPISETTWKKSDTDLLVVDNIQTYIGQFYILQGISLKIKQGACTVLLGRNGAGKSTTLKTIMGVTPPRYGNILYNGKSIAKQTPFQIARHGIGYVPEDRAIFRDMTVMENLQIAARGVKTSEYNRRRDFCLELFPDMERFMRQKAGTLSGGQQQMVAISRGLMRDNQLLIIDEPSKGLAPIVVQAVIDALAKLKSHITILLVEQNFTMASTLGDYFYLIDDGENVANGAMSDLIHDHDLTKKYLGVS